MALDIVIIDDAPFIRQAIRHIVESAGMRVLAEATDGVEAVNILKNLDPDLVIMDLVMPHKNGVTAVKEILELKPELKILACSTESQKEMTLLALEAGCRGFVAKPFAAKALVDKINQLVALS